LLYFDHNASTPVFPEVVQCYAQALQDVFGNASSLHRHGQIARRELERSRQVVASFVNAHPSEVVFTSGGTESNNLAVLGFVRQQRASQKHIITSEVEHPSVLQACGQLEREGCQVTWLQPDSAGRISVRQVEEAIRPETILVSLMHANNETGVIQPVEEVSAVIQQLRQSHPALRFHCDGVQALGKLPIDFEKAGFDLYSLSAHKVGGPKGVGALIVRKGTPLKAAQLGGKHERERRAGTENVPGAVAFSKALECFAQQNHDVAGLRDAFEAEVLSRVPGAIVNGAGAPRLPNTSNILFPSVSGEAMVIALDMKGFAVSTGAACSSGSTEPSHVLLAMKLKADDARRCIRFSFGPMNRKEDVSLLAGAVAEIANRNAHKLFRKDVSVVAG
jgi:cysteine desulfurase